MAIDGSNIPCVAQETLYTTLEVLTSHIRRVERTAKDRLDALERKEVDLYRLRRLDAYLLELVEEVEKVVDVDASGLTVAQKLPLARLVTSIKEERL